MIALTRLTQIGDRWMQLSGYRPDILSAGLAGLELESGATRESAALAPTSDQQGMLARQQALSWIGKTRTIIHSVGKIYTDLQLTDKSLTRNAKLISQQLDFNERCHKMARVLRDF